MPWDLVTLNSGQLKLMNVRFLLMRRDKAMLCQLLRMVLGHLGTDGVPSTRLRKLSTQDITTSVNSFSGRSLPHES